MPAGVGVDREVLGSPDVQPVDDDVQAGLPEGCPAGAISTCATARAKLAPVLEGPRGSGSWCQAPGTGQGSARRSRQEHRVEHGIDLVAVEVAPSTSANWPSRSTELLGGLRSLRRCCSSAVRSSSGRR